MIENIEDKEGDKEDEAECVYEEREAITLVICRVTLVVSCPQAIGDQPSLLQLHAIPHICQFWGTTTLFRSVQSASKSVFI